ncbi:MAG: hypothetical protein GX057_04505 [Clostridiales bacterium]|nr:hypothetical protein [Clostridiales bacterium]
MADKKEERRLVEGKYLMYKNRPLVREGNTICYGDMSEKCILVLEIISYKKVDGHEVPDTILIQIIDSKDPTRIIKQGTKEGLYDAFSMGVVWLDVALRQAD